MHESSKIFLDNVNNIKPDIAVILGSGLTNFFDDKFNYIINVLKGQIRIISEGKNSELFEFAKTKRCSKNDTQLGLLFAPDIGVAGDPLKETVANVQDV